MSFLSLVALPDAPYLAAPFDFSSCGAVGLGFPSSASLYVVDAFSVPQFVLFADKTQGIPTLRNADPRGCCWPLVGRTRSGDVSYPLPWAPMAFKAPFIKT